MPPKEITNPVIGTFGTDSNFGLTISKIIVLVWQTLITAGGILALIWMFYGGITWLTAGGDKQKLENGRDRITNAIIGLTILFASVAFVNFIGPAVGLDVLNLSI